MNFIMRVTHRGSNVGITPLTPPLSLYILLNVKTSFKIYRCTLCLLSTCYLPAVKKIIIGKISYMHINQLFQKQGQTFA